MLKILKKIGQTLKGCYNCLFLALHTVFWCFFMYILFIFKVLSPTQKVLNFFNKWLLFMADNWIASDNFMMDSTMNIKWELPDFCHLEYKQWYFIICNHQSWTDILVLQRIFLKKIPFIRFFIKKELMWLPVLNLAWWAYDFPIMHRHTKEQIEKNPTLRNKDLMATKKACLRYQHMPVTILNFLEGTRFTPAKHQKQHSAYKHLLNPKLGGFAYAVNAMDKKITHILDITIIYPEGRKTFWDFLCGRVHHIVVKLVEREIPSDLLQGNYVENEEYRNNFKNWINRLWVEKDAMLSRFLNSH
ncbi:MAG: acyltransferase [Proteobacteria bacterium]|nr:acyltransferase [Pseudomonadota bacterium]